MKQTAGLSFMTMLWSRMVWIRGDAGIKPFFLGKKLAVN
jgi:hypothetical protein